MYEYSNEIVQCEVRMMEDLRKSPDIKVFERGMDGWAFILLGEDEIHIKALSEDYLLVDDIR